MYTKVAECKSWNDILKLTTQLIIENENLKLQKQKLTNEVVRLKLQMKQEERRKSHTYEAIVSDLEKNLWVNIRERG